MNPSTEPPIPELQPPQPPQPHRPSTSCDRHPDEHFTGFCPSCLCERLAVLEPSSNGASSSSSSRKPSAAAAAIKAIFKPSAAPSSSSSSFLPELRRTKSFSASKNEGFFSGIFEPQRKSCDVRVRNTLWNLFTLDDETKITDAESRNLPSSSIQRRPVLESKEEDTETEAGKPNIEEVSEEEEDEIRALEEARKSNVVEDRVPEIVQEEEEEEEEEEEPLEIVTEDIRTMKDHIDLDSNLKKPSSGRDLKDIAGSFWSAASVFSKKLQKWRRKQKLKKQREAGEGGCSATLPVEKPISRQFRETQSEIADYGFGRRSCDTDPRFSLDAGRISFDDSRYSFDEPRASWDGYLIGRSFPPPRMGPTMLSVVEDSPPVHHVLRTDSQIPVEEPPMKSIDEDDGEPGGSAQTRDYYLDSSSRRRKSLDRSSSIRKTAAAVVAEMDELKSVKNAKVSPATVDYFQGTKLIVGERDLRDLRDSRDSNSNSLRDDCSDMFEIGFRDSASVIENGERKGSKKSSRWKAWSIWGFIHRRGGNKDENDDRYSSRGNGVERSFSESWQDRNGDPRLAFNRKVFRSNSSVSSRNSYSLGGSFGRKNGNMNGIEMNGHGKKRRDEFVLERNRSARYSPSNVDNGLLRFYLTPLRGSRRGGGGGGIGVGPGKGRAGPVHSFARSMLRLY